MSSPHTVHPMEESFRAWSAERAAQDRKIEELWKAVQGEQHDNALDYFRRGFFLGGNYCKDQLASEASPLGHAATEAECVAKCLDEANVPKAEEGKPLSLWGRVVRYAASPPPPGGRVPLTEDGWEPIETAPDDELVVVFYLQKEGDEEVDMHTLDFKEEGCWFHHNDHYEHFVACAPPGSIGPSENAPYTHWKRLGTPHGIKEGSATPLGDGGRE